MEFSRRTFGLLAAAVLAVGGCSSQVNAGAPAGGTLPGASADAASPAPELSSAAPSSAAPSASPSRSAAAKTTRPETYAFPVIGRNSYAHVHHDYPATDVMTACGNRFVAVTSGMILAVTRVDRWKPSVNAGATRGGLSVSLLGDDGARYYGSHLSTIEPAIRPGARVRTGQTLGRTGETGDASACHLHFGISPPCARVGDWWIQRGVIWPWPYLDAWRTGQNRSAAAAVTAWKRVHGCPTTPLTP